MSTRITEAALGVLTDLADYRMLSLSQVAHLHFGGKRSARRRMQQLLEDGLVELLPGTSGAGGGRPENTYGLSRAGLQLLKSKAGLDERITFEQAGGGNLLHQISHQLLLGWCRLHLVHVCRTIPRLACRLMTCNSPAMLNPESGISRVRAVLRSREDDRDVHFTPDAVFIVTDTERERSVLFFVEVDMGTEPLTSDEGGDIREKILRYKQYFVSKAYKQYEHVWRVGLNGFRLLFLARTHSRAESLCGTVRRMSPAGFVWVTSKDRMLAEGISGKIWFPGGRSDGAAESILDGFAVPLPLPELTD